MVRPPGIRRAAIAALIGLVGLLGWMSVALRAEGSPVAAWWPAAGVAVIAVLASRGSRLVATAGVLVATLVANALVGRELGLAVGYAIANAAEAYVVAQFASRGGPEARLDSLRDISRFIIAAVLGALTIGVIGGLTAAVVVQADLFATLFALVSSHGSAILIVAPIALVSRRLARGVSRVEVLIQLLVLILIVGAVFWPGNVLPVAFVPLVALLWAAFRLPITVVAVELLVLAVLATTLAGMGGGAIGQYAASDPRMSALLLQLFLVVHACAALFVCAARNDWANVVTQLGAREALLRGGIVNSETGILIAEILDSDRLRVVGVNPTALSALGRETMPPTWGVVGLRIARGQPVFGVAELDDGVRRREASRFELEREGRRFDVDLGIHDGVGGASVMTIVFTDVTARDERERRAIEAAEQMRDLNRQKDDFIASVSHELRTPVTSILGFVEDLDGADLRPSERVATEVIARNARRLADVIEDVLELGKLSSFAAGSRPAVAFDVVALTRHCAQDAEGLAAGRAVRLIVESPVDALPIRSVPQDLTRVLANLLSNAVKFTPDGGSIEVRIDPSAAGVDITITDHGPGIPPAVLGHVWDRFYRVSDAEHRDVPGTGLGLPIVRALVEQRLSGRVELSSDGATGTTARVSLPWDRDAVQADAPGAIDEDHTVAVGHV
nr:ATP-binding protein [Microcella alkalica]